MSASTIDLSFPIRLLSDRAVPFDHGHMVYGAVARLIPTAHQGSWLGIHPLGGVPEDDSTRLRPGARSTLRFRLSAEHISTLLPLTGAELRLGDARVELGAPTVLQLRPAPWLDARHVLIRLTRAPRRSDGTIDKAEFEERFAEEFLRQLRALDIDRPFRICGRRRLTVHGRRLLGYSVQVAELSAEESLRLQVEGIGGKRAFGCGLFRPARSP